MTFLDVSAENWTAYVIVIAPIALYIITLLIIKSRLPKDFLANALREPIRIEDLNKITSAKNNNPSNPIPDNLQKRSSSRLIAFLSGITSLTLASIISSFYFYINIFGDNPTEVNMTGFANILLALGIGVVPYAVNKVSG